MPRSTDQRVDAVIDGLAAAGALRLEDGRK